MVAQCASVKTNGIHGLVGGQLLVAGQRADHRLVVGQGRALDGVAVVDQQVIGKVDSGLFDQRSRALQPQTFILSQFEIVVTDDIGMEIRGFQNGQLCGG